MTSSRPRARTTCSTTRRKCGLSLKYLREFGAEDRFEGNVLMITFGLPLDPLFEKIRGAL
jgi:hypothetical protein